MARAHLTRAIRCSVAAGDKDGLTKTSIKRVRKTFIVMVFMEIPLYLRNPFWGITALLAAEIASAAALTAAVSSVFISTG